LAEGALPPAGLAQQFAVQLAGTLWNGDHERPLFANYWDGSNGWYRVAYDNGSKTCVEGVPPWGLSDSFATGGYASWAGLLPLLGELGQGLYRLTQSQDPEAQAFIAAHYSQLGPKASTNNRMLSQLMFWPSLVQGSSKF
jgi:hypothetical protein